MAKKYDSLKLENQLCFPIYACSREIIKKYKPFLDELGLTYTQYITMMVLWEKEKISAKEIGGYLHLDSGTLTSVLKKLEQSGYIKRRRSAADERVLDVVITHEGRELKEAAHDIPEKLFCSVGMEKKEIKALKKSLEKALRRLSK